MVVYYIYIMEINHRAVTPQEINTNLKITRLDLHRILDQVRNLINKLQELKENNEEINDEFLQTEYEYLYTNLPIMFQAIRDDPTLPFDLLEKQITTAYLIGMKDFFISYAQSDQKYLL